MNVSEQADDFSHFLYPPRPVLITLEEWVSAGFCIRLLVVSCALGKTTFQEAGTADPAAGDETSAADDGANDDVADRQQPEREPVQRRVTVRVVARVRGPIAVRRIDPVISCEHRHSMLAQRSRTSCYLPRLGQVQCILRHSKRHDSLQQYLLKGKQN